MTQRTPLQSLSPHSVNASAVSRQSLAFPNEQHPTAMAVLVDMDMEDHAPTQHPHPYSSPTHHSFGDSSDEAPASPPPTVETCEDCNDGPREYGLQGETSPRFCRECAILHRIPGRPTVVRIPPIPGDGPSMEQPAGPPIDISQHPCEDRVKRRRRQHLDAAAKTAIATASTLERIVDKRANYDDFREQMFGGLHPNNSPISLPCKPQTCDTCDCLSLFGKQPEAAVKYLHSLRVSMVGPSNRTKRRTRKRRRKHGQFYETAAVAVRGHQAQRRKRLLQELRHCVFYDADTKEYCYDFSLPAHTGQRRRVCGNFFRVVLGYAASNTQWRNAIRDTVD